MTSHRRVLLRADATHDLGFGHVGRLYALYEELVAHGRDVQLLFGGDGHAITGWLHDRNLHGTPTHWSRKRVLQLVHDLRQPLTVVLDGQAVVADLAPALLALPTVNTVALDDKGGLDLALHAVVNHNVHAPALAGSYGARRKLLGRRYALLRKDIRRLTRGSCRPGRGARPRVVITFGGSDPVGATARALRLLPRDPGLDVVVIEGPAFHHDAAMTAAVAAARAAGHHVDLHRAPKDPGALFGTADCAIAAAGGTLGELAYLGCPAIAYAIVEDQFVPAQVQAADGLIAGGGVWGALTDAQLADELAAFLGDSTRRAELRERALATIDGDGPRRIIDEALGPDC